MVLIQKKCEKGARGFNHFSDRKDSKSNCLTAKASSFPTRSLDFV